MNKQLIEKFARRAGFNPYNFQGANSELFQAFAHIIVEQCKIACSNASEVRWAVPPSQDQVLLECLKQIDEHFEVKQW